MTTQDNARLLLLIEEYKTLREEIGRFQNQQKQSLMFGVGAIALALFSSALQSTGVNFVDRPFLLLLLPLILAPIGILYFETEISIFRAGTYLGVNLKNAAEVLCFPLNGIWDWENYRAHEALAKKKIESYGWSKWILFLWPPPACLILFFVICIFIRMPRMKTIELFGHLLLLAINFLLVFVLFRYYRKADLMWNNLDAALRNKPGLNVTP